MLLLFKAGNLHSQTLKILYASENVKSQESGKVLLSDYKLLGEEKIILPSNRSQLIVWDEFEGMCLVKGQSQKGGRWKLTGTVNELKVPMTALPMKERNEYFGSLGELRARLEGQNFLILGDSWLICKPGEFRPDGDTVVFVHYRDAIDNLQASRKLEFGSDTLLLHPDLILDNNGVRVKAENTSNFELLWINRVTHEMEPMCSFNCIMPDDEKLSSEVGLLISLLSQKQYSADGMKPWIHAFLSTAYGNADRHNLEEWLVLNFPYTFH